MLLTLTAGIALTYWFGIYGTLVGAALTQVAMVAVLAYKLAQVTREPIEIKTRPLPPGRGAW